MNLFEEALKFFEDNDIPMRDNFSAGQVAHMMADFAKQRIEERMLTDEEIEAKYPRYYNDKFHRKDTVNDYNLHKQEGAKWSRDFMKGGIR